MHLFIIGDFINDSVQIEEEALHIIARHSNGIYDIHSNILEICALTVTVSSHRSLFHNIPVSEYEHGQRWETGYYDVLSGFQKSIQ